MDLINTELHIKKGDQLTKKELKSRLTQMEVSLSMEDNLKGFYVELYDKAIKEPQNINKIRELLIKDTDQEKEREKNKKVHIEPKLVKDEGNDNFLIEYLDNTTSTTSVTNTNDNITDTRKRMKSEVPDQQKKTDLTLDGKQSVKFDENVHMEDLVLPTKVDERLESNINATTRNNKSFQDVSPSEQVFQVKSTKLDHKIFNKESNLPKNTLVKVQNKHPFNPFDKNIKESNKISNTNENEIKDYFNQIKERSTDNSSKDTTIKIDNNSNNNNNTSNNALVVNSEHKPNFPNFNNYRNDNKDSIRNDNDNIRNDNINREINVNEHQNLGINNRGSSTSNTNSVYNQTNKDIIQPTDKVVHFQKDTILNVNLIKPGWGSHPNQVHNTNNDNNFQQNNLQKNQNSSQSNLQQQPQFQPVGRSSTNSYDFRNLNTVNSDNLVKPSGNGSVLENNRSNNNSSNNILNSNGILQRNIPRAHTSYTNSNNNSNNQLNHTFTSINPNILSRANTNYNNSSNNITNTNNNTFRDNTPFASRNSVDNIRQKRSKLDVVNEEDNIDVDTRRKSEEIREEFYNSNSGTNQYNNSNSNQGKYSYYNYSDFNSTPNANSKDNVFSILKILGLIGVGGTTLYLSYQYFDRDSITNLLDSLRTQLSDLVINNNSFFSVSQASSNLSLPTVPNNSTDTSFTSNLRGLTWESLLNIFYENQTLFLIILALMICFVYAYYSHKNSHLINELFEKILAELKEKRDKSVDNEDNTNNNLITEDEIVTRYSAEYQIDENYFRSTILPALESKRSANSKIKKHEETFYGKQKLAWEYTD